MNSEFWQPTTKYEVLADLQQNILVPIHSVHDEIDLLVDWHLSYGILSRCATMASAKSVWDKLGTGFIDYTFDVEFDPEGSWQPTDSYSIYTDAHSHTEYEAKCLLDANYSTLPEYTLEVETLDQIHHIINDKTLVSFADACYVTIKTKDGKEHKPNRPYSKKLVEEFLATRGA